MEKNMEITIGFRVYGLEGMEHGNYYNGLCRDYYEDPFLQS